MKTSAPCKVIMTVFIMIGFFSLTIYYDMINDNKKLNIVMADTTSKPNEPEEIIEPEIVFDGLTFDELVEKLERSMYDDLSGYGNYFASYALSLGIDPYLALAIVSEETGCKWGCSYLVKACHNIGGMIGSGCNGFSYFDSLEEGITYFLDNLKRNYYDYGLTTADTMNPKYAESPLWASHVNAYIEIIKNA